MLLRKLALAALGVVFAAPALAETIDIAIGHQSMCTDTYTAGIIVKELGLLEKHLPHDGKYAGVTYNVTWNDYSSGGPITNEMLANKLAFGVMGDYPLIVNGAKFQATDSLRSLYVAGVDRSQEPGAIGRCRQYPDRQDRRACRFLPVVRDHGVSRHRAEDLRR